MIKMKLYLLICISAIMALGSCVPGGRYRTLHDKSVQYMNERDAFKTENLDLSMRNREMASRLGSIEEELAGLEGEKEKLQQELNEARAEYSDINNRYTELQNAQEDLIRGNVTETRRLLRELQDAQENLQNKEGLMRQLELNMEARRAELDQLSYELEQRDARLSELEQILEDQTRIVKDLKNKVSDALFGFEGDGLTVSMKNGKVYVSLEEKLLFRTGSYNIDANGRNALKKLAAVLKNNPDIQITIEGHTDDVPYISSGGPIQDNWDLSVKRATTVVRVLLDGTGIDPKRLTAAGRGEYLPVDNAKTAEARRKNRRTEIILTPDLSELNRIIESY
ncbi:MAG: OmpA family protein [Bacteroidales bacterium]|nr:OmpA family protein [Bacteroidales bacterium]